MRPARPGLGKSLVDTVCLPETEKSSPAAIGDLYDTHRDRVFAWALRYTAGDQDLAEDLVQEVFLKALQCSKVLERPSELAGWLYRVTANLALNRLRAKRSFIKSVVRLLGDARPEPSLPSAELELREETTAALALLGRLPDRERVVVTMKLIDDQSQREIAHALGMSEGYVSKLLARALERLKGMGWEADDGNQ
ncbi:MAG: sigma-70 family RNA polymerase sigma factor [Deltaproteobacteria bacterium]|nr:sigma-70 family RNA polymerase sigma factor [Deltaproteobacteria bacterium]